MHIPAEPRLLQVLLYQPRLLHLPHTEAVGLHQKRLLTIPVLHGEFAVDQRGVYEIKKPAIMQSDRSIARDCSLSKAKAKAIT